MAYKAGPLPTSVGRRVGLAAQFEAIDKIYDSISSGLAAVPSAKGDEDQSPAELGLLESIRTFFPDAMASPVSLQRLNDIDDPAGGTADGDVVVALRTWERVEAFFREYQNIWRSACSA